MLHPVPLLPPVFHKPIRERMCALQYRRLPPAICLFVLIGPSLFTPWSAIADEDVPPNEIRTAKQKLVLTETNLKIVNGKVEGKTAIEVSITDLGFPPGGSVGWDLGKSIAGQILTCGVTGEELSLSVDRSGHVDIYASNHRIMENEPGELVLTIKDPKTISPGVYQGTVKFELQGGKGFQYNVPASWTIRIVVPGRFLKPGSMTFDHATADGALHVGQPATVSIRLDTFGCDPGRGDLTLKFTRHGGDPLPILSLRVPFDGIRDPVRDFDKQNTVCREWRNSPVHVTPPDEQNSGLRGDHYVHTFQVNLGDCFTPGERLEAEIKWDQAPEAPAVASKNLVDSVRAKVNDGILAPQIGFENESIYIEVVSRKDLGLEPKLAVFGPKGTGRGDLDLTAFQQEGETTSQGAVFPYYAYLVPDQLGEWRLSLPSQTGDAGVSAQIQVWGRQNNQLEYASPDHQCLPWPLRVFATRVPLGWGVIRGSVEEGRAYYQYRRNAFELGFDPRYAREVEFRPISLNMRIPTPKGDEWELQPLNEQIHPLLQVSAGGFSGADTPRADKGNMEARPEELRSEESGDRNPVIRLTDQQTIPFHVFCAAVPMKSDHPRKASGTHEFVYRGLLTGKDTEGNLIARVVEVPFAIEVANCREYDAPVIAGMAIMALLALALFIAWWKANREPRSSVVAGGNGSGIDAELQRELFGGGIAAATDGGARQSPPQASNDNSSGSGPTVEPESRADEPEPPRRRGSPPPDPDIMGDFM